jgi:hypothetical protein
MDSTYRVLRNSGEAYRQFRSFGFIAGTHEMVLGLVRHRLFGGALALMGSAGLIAGVITFWPR